MSTAFDLEQQIMSAWQIVDDLKILTDSEALTEDQRLNILLGLQALYQLKFEQLFNTFEQLLREHYVEKTKALVESMG